MQQLKKLELQYMEFKCEFWGIFAPIIAIFLFKSIALSGGIVLFSFILMWKNNHKEEAKRTMFLYACTIVGLIGTFMLLATLAVFA